MENAGLSLGQWATIYACLKTSKNIEKAVLYGSRTMAFFSSDSDVEIMLYGKKLTENDIEQMKSFLEDEMLSYNLIFTIFDSRDLELAQHVKKYGKEIRFK